MENETIQLFKVNMTKELDSVIDTLNSGFITQGKKVMEFEDKLKEWFNYPYILTLNSATSGLTLAFKLLNSEKEKDYVLSTPLTCFATNASILANNLKIVWCDTDPNTCNIDLEDVKRRITEKTTILTFVHWGGNIVDLDKVDELKKYAKEKYGTNLNVIEDCAHAFGSEYKNQKIGTFGNNICVFSLQAIKHLTTGDGGLIFLPNKELYERAKLLRWFGIDREKRSLPGKDFRLENDIVEYGYKYHMNDINASIGLSNLPNIDSVLQKCRFNGDYYNKNLTNIDGIEMFDYECNPSYWIYTIKILYGKKDEFIEFMNNKKIVVSQVHSRNDTHTCLKEFKTTDLLNLDLLEKQIISIPVGWWLTKDNLEYIICCIKEFSQIHLIVKISKLKKDEIDEYLNLLFEMNNFRGTEINLTDDSINSIYTLKVNERIVCSAKLLIENKAYQQVAHIEDVVTGNIYRKRGYGAKIIKELVKIAFHKFNCYKIICNSKTNLSKFYQSCGFSVSGNSYSIYNENNES